MTVVCACTVLEYSTLPHNHSHDHARRRLLARRGQRPEVLLPQRLQLLLRLLNLQSRAVQPVSRPHAYFLYKITTEIHRVVHEWLHGPWVASKPAGPAGAPAAARARPPLPPRPPVIR